MTSTPKRPRDPNQLAKFIVDTATGDNTAPESGLTRRAAAGGKKGGPARAKTLSATQRADIARLAAEARWKKS